MNMANRVGKSHLPLLAAPGVRQRMLTFFLWTPVCIKREPVQQSGSLFYINEHPNEIWQQTDGRILLYAHLPGYLHLHHHLMIPFIGFVR